MGTSTSTSRANSSGQSENARIIITIEGSMMIILRDILINNIGRKMEER